MHLSNFIGTNLSGILNMYINAPAMYIIPPVAKLIADASGIY